MSEAIAGSVVAKLGYDTTGLRKGEREAEQSLRKVDESLATTGRNTQKLGDHFSTTGKILGGLAGLKIAGALTHGLEESIRQASDLNETISKTKVVFGDSFDRVDQFAKGAARGLGESRQAAEEAAATYGNLFVSMGVGKDAAASMSTTLVQLAGDLASFNNTSTADALDALKSGLVGEVEPLRRYGVAIDDATLRQKALELGLVSSTKNALQPAIRTQAAYALILDKTKTAQGDFARTSDGNANSLRIMQAEAKDAEAALGQGLLPVQLSLVKTANDLLPAMQGISKAISSVGSNDTARQSIEVVAGVAAALYGLSKAIGISKAIRDSELLSLLRGTAAREASTAAIIAEGEAATVTSSRLGVLSAAEIGAMQGGGAAAAGTRFGTGLGKGVVATGAVTAAVVGYQVDQQIQQDANRRGGALGKAEEIAGDFDFEGLVRGNRKAYNFLHGLFHGDDKPKDKPQDTSPAVYDVPYAMTPAGLAANRLASTQSALSKAHAGVSNVDAIKTETGIVGGIFGGVFDVLPKTQQDDVAGAQDKLASAQDRATNAADRLKSAQERLEAAQRRLSDLRASGKASTTQLADAEDRLAAARRNLDAANRNSGRVGDSVSKAEDALNKAKQGTDLSAKDLLGRLTGQAGHAEDLAKANDKLAASGLTKPVIESIDQLEKEAPGTIAKVAAGLTPAMVKSLNSQFGKLQAAQHEFLTAPLRAAERAARVENERAAAAYAKAYADALARHFADLELPMPGQKPYTGKPVIGQPLPPDAATHEGRTAQAPTYDLRGSTIVASDPTALEAELARRARVAALAGRA